MQQVNILVGRFQPITKGHIKCIQYVWDKFHIPTVLCMINTPDTKVDERHPFPSSLLMPLYEELFKGDKRICDIVLVKNADIVAISTDLKGRGYDIQSWTCGTDRYDAYSKMADRYGEQAGLPDGFEVIEIKRSDADESATKLRSYLLAGDRDRFMKMSPYMPMRTYLNLNYYDTLKKQIDIVYKK